MAPHCRRSTSSKSPRKSRSGCRRVKPRSPATSLDIQPFSAVLDSSPIELATTNPAHLSLPQSEAGALREIEVDLTEQTLSGNTVNLEQQMINLGDVNRDYSMSANIRRAFHQLILSAIK
jgi:flagellar basal-body rod protein FlgB